MSEKSPGGPFMKFAEFWNSFHARVFWRNLPYAQFAVMLIPLYLMIGIVLWRFGGSDGAVYDYFKVYSWQHPRLSDALDTFTSLGNPFFYGIYFLLALFAVLGRGNRKNFLAMTGAYLLSEILVVLCVGQLLKFSIGRPRPRLESAEFQPFLRGHNSMPSGHTYELVNSLLPLGFFRKYAIAVAGGILLASMGFTRIYLTAHFVSDVAAAPLLGVPSAVLTLFFREYFVFLLSEREKAKLCGENA